jgi:hypothetical protein
MSVLTDNLAAKSWYREPWPWLLMTGPFAVVVAGFFTLWLAIRSDDGLVADDYYKRGLAINQTLSRAQLAAQLNLGARIMFGADLRTVRVELAGDSASPEVLRLRLVHPTRSVADQSIILHTVTQGVYAGDLVAPVAGRRVVMLEDIARTWRLAGEASNEAQATVVLVPQ